MKRDAGKPHLHSDACGVKGGGKKVESNKKKLGLHFIGFEFDFSRSSFSFILWRSWSMMGENCPPENLRSFPCTSFPQGVNGFRKSEISARTMLRPQMQWTHHPQPLLLFLCSASLPLRFLRPLTKMRFQLLHQSGPGKRPTSSFLSLLRFHL